MRTVGMGLMILMFVTGAAAQINTAEIAGVVKDTSGGVLPGATVTAKHPASGTMVERVTDGEGRFFLPALRIGQWDVTVTMSGFAPQTMTLALEIGRTLAVDFSLRVEGALRAGHRSVDHAPSANGQRGDQRRHREPRGRRDAAERTQLSRSRPAQRRRRHPAGRHARRSPSAGWPASQRGGAAIGAQHLPARRHQGHRRALQQPRHQSVGRFDRGVQDPEIDVSGGIRGQGVGADQRRDEGRLEQVPRQSVRVQPKRVPSTRRTTSSRRGSPFRRCARTSSEARSAGRSSRTERSSSAATKANE